MARKYVPKTRKLRRTYNKNKKRYAKRNMLSFYKAPMPNIFATKLRYAQSFTINPPSAGAIGTYIISANSLYDPNVTSTGHQPRGFDQLMTMYDHYTVIGSKITVTYTTAGLVGSSGPLCVGVALKDGPTPESNKNDYMEGRNIRSGILLRSAGSDDAHMLKLSNTFSVRKFLGVSKPLANKVIQGSASQSPGEQAYFHIFGQVLTGLSDSNPFDVQIVIDYLTVFQEPKQPAQS